MTVNEFVFTNDVDAQINNISYIEPFQITTEGTSVINLGWKIHFSR
jgi:transposase